MLEIPLLQPPSPFKDVDIMLLEAHAFYDAREYDKAKTMLDKGISLWQQLDEDSVSLKVLYYQGLFSGIISFSAGHYEEAESSLQNTLQMVEDSLRTEPDGVLVYLWLGNTQYSLYRYKDAIASYLSGEEKAVQLTGSSSLLSRVFGHNMYAVLLADLQNLARNDKLISSGVGDDPGTFLDAPKIQIAGTTRDSLMSIRTQIESMSQHIFKLTGNSRLFWIAKSNSDIAVALGEYLIKPDAQILPELNMMLDAFLLQTPLKEIGQKKKKKKKKGKKGKKGNRK